MKNFKMKTGLCAAVMTLALTGCNILGNLANFGETSGTDKIGFTVEETKTNIDNIAKASGIEIIYEYRGTDEESKGEKYSYGRKGNVSWSIDNESGKAYKILDDNKSYYVYAYNSEEKAWEYRYEDTFEQDETREQLDYSLSVSLYVGHLYDGSLKKTGSTTIAGRSCDTYIYALNLIVEKFEFKLAIDKETGITMSYDIGGYSGTESASEGFVVTSFKTNGITAPSLPDKPVEE